jgi:hypothetical protein
MYQQRATTAVVDPTAQLLELADLFGRGLLSQDEFEQHKARVLDP